MTGLYWKTKTLSRRKNSKTIKQQGLNLTENLKQQKQKHKKQRSRSRWLVKSHWKPKESERDKWRRDESNGLVG